MDKSEQIAESHLRSRGFQDIMYEPDGNVPPDFLVDGQIAVEVRRLNQNEDTAEGPRGFEEVAIPLQDAVKRLLNELGPSRDGQSWYVMYDFRRPLAADWRPALRASLVAFRDGAERRPGRRVVVPRFKVLVRLFAATVLAVFPFGGFTILLALRVGRTYGVSGGDLSAFIARRAPRWQRHVGIGVLVYALIHLVAFGAVGAQKSTGATHVPLVASAFVVWFYLMFMQVFTVGLRDPKVVEPKAHQGDQARA